MKRRLIVWMHDGLFSPKHVMSVTSLEVGDFVMAMMREKKCAIMPIFEREISESAADEILKIGKEIQP